jgi:hypothetical protein
MVAAFDKSMKVHPLFSGIKSSKERREAELKWLACNPAMRDAMLAAYEGLRNVKSDDSDES